MSMTEFPPTELTPATAASYYNGLRAASDADKVAGLKRLRDMFRAAGNNPDSPSDPMYDQMGVAKDFFDLVLRSAAARMP